MRIIDLYNVSLRNLFRNSGRTLVNSLIIALGSIIIIMTSSLSIGINKVAKNQILQTRAMREITVLQDNFSATPRQLDFRQLDNLKKIEHVDTVYPDVQLTVGLYNGSEWLGVGNVRGIPKLGLPSIIDGKEFNDNDINIAIIPNKLSSTDGVVDGKDYIGKELQVEYSTIGKDNQQVSKKYNAKVVGIYDHTKKDLPSNAILIPINDVYKISAENKGQTQTDFLKLSTFNAATVIVNDEEHLDHVSSLIENQGFRTNSIHKELNNMPGATKFIIVIGSFISIIVLISGSISIGATMLQTTKNRSKEIGLMKAIGYFDKDIFNIFLLEAIFTGLSGGIIGISVSYIALFIIEVVLSKNQSFTSLSLNISITSIIIVCSVCLFIPYIGSVFPIVKASKISPSEALRSE